MPTDPTQMHPLPRPGTSQVTREVPSLNPATTPIEDRGESEQLGFTVDLSRFIRYVDGSNVEQGNWTDFWASYDLPAAARLAHHRLPLAAPRWRPTNTALDDDTAINTLFDILMAGPTLVGKTIHPLRSDSVLKPALKEIALTEVRPLLVHVLAVARAYPSTTGAVLGLTLSSTWNDDWLIQAEELDRALADIQPPFVPGDGPQTRRLLIKQIRPLDRVLLRFQQTASKLLATSVDSPGQPAHLGLFRVFLKLFEKARERLNDLTRRHLHHAYADVLHIESKARQGDAAFVLFELAKHAEPFALPAGTLLDGGKDDAKIPVRYALTEELALNGATVASLRSINVDSLGTPHVAPVANSIDGEGEEPLTDEVDYWPPFGRNDHGEGRLGLLIASPTLRLSDGTRTITLSLAFSESSLTTFKTAVEDTVPNGLSPESVQSIVNALRVSVSVEEEWMELTNVASEWRPTVEVSDRDLAGSLQISVTLSDEDPALVSATSEVHGTEADLDAPALRLLFKAGQTLPASTLALLEISDGLLHVEVTESRAFAIETDFGSVDHTKPFPPFGGLPTVGSTFRVSSDEILGSKSLQSLDLNLDWKDAPSDIGTYYAAYQAGSIAFEITARHRNEVVTRDLFNGPITFARDDLLASQQPGLDAAIEVIRCELTSPSFAFGHKVYPTLYAKASIAATRETPEVDSTLLDRIVARTTLSSKALASPLKDTIQVFQAQLKQATSLDLPNPPYTPELKSCTLSYRANEALLAGDSATVWHLEPFGSLPPIRRTLLPAMPNEGDLRIGLAGAEAGDAVSLLFSLAQGTGEAFLATPDVVWSYLDGDRWQTLTPDVDLFDRTRGLVETGIVRIQLPTTLDTSSRRMPGDEIYLRATVSERSRAMPHLHFVRAQAAEAELVEGDNADSHYAEPLAAGTIKKLAIPDNRIKSLEQPLPSAGGAPAEAEDSYRLRVSERLRHKDRAITVWDYEHLLLDRFPTLHRAKAIAHSDRRSIIEPGRVLIAVVPDLRQTPAASTLYPASSQGEITEMTSHLEARCSAWVDLEVVNPRYERIQITTTVALHPGYDRNLYQDQLGEDLKRFLSPWAYDDGAELSFGGSLHRSLILNFMEERAYLDYIAEFQFTVSFRDPTNGEETILARDLEEIIASQPHAVLASAPSHRVTVL